MDKEDRIVRIDFRVFQILQKDNGAPDAEIDLFKYTLAGIAVE